jgi:hypothetical protein
MHKWLHNRDYLMVHFLTHGAQRSAGLYSMTLSFSPGFSPVLRETNRSREPFQRFAIIRVKTCNEVRCGRRAAENR